MQEKAEEELTKHINSLWLQEEQEIIEWEVGRREGKGMEKEGGDEGGEL